MVKRTGDGILIEFRSVVDAVRCAIELQNGMTERNTGLPPERRIEFRIGIHLGDVVEEADGDLMGDGVNIAARLEGVANPSAICLSEDAYRQVREKIKETFLDLGEKELKNIARPVRVYALRAESGNGRTARGPVPAEKPGRPRLSIVVLPFANIGGDAEQEYFVDGVTESLTTDLSRIRGAFVIGRNTAFTYKGKAVDLKAIGRELNVRYVLEGSVQRGGSRMRVNVQLIDAENRAHLWAERFDKTLADLFDMQDEIVARLASTLNTQLVAAEARRAEQAPTPDSMDLYFQGRAWFNRGVTPDTVAKARGFFDRALAADPGNVDAVVESGRTDMIASVHAFAADPRAALAAAEAKLTAALSLVPDHALALWILGHVEILSRRGAQGIAKCQHALGLDRNLVFAHASIGVGKLSIGHAEKSEAHVVEALRLSPRDPFSYIWMSIAGTAKVQLGSYDEAVAWFRRAIEANRNYPHAHFVLGAALAQLGRLDEAHAAVKAGLALNPTYAIARARAAGMAMSDDSTYRAQLESILDGLRKAGMPEQ